MNNNKQLIETLKVPLTILSFRRRSKFPKLHQKIIQKANIHVLQKSSAQIKPQPLTIQSVFWVFSTGGTPSPENLLIFLTEEFSPVESSPNKFPFLHHQVLIVPQYNNFHVITQYKAKVATVSAVTSFFF